MSELTVKVAKFGGTSVADFDAMMRCAAIVKNNTDVRVVVVSASSGVTNLLVQLSQERMEAEQYQIKIEEIRAIQYRISARLPNETELNQQIDVILDELSTLVHRQNNQPSGKNSDEILSFGERLSSLLFTQVLKTVAVPGYRFDVREVMRTNSLYGQAVVDTEQLKENASELLAPLLSDNVVVTQGFIGRDGLGNTTTLGRGGSDYSAALLGEALGATGVDIWTDVVGIFTTDPRITDSARPLAEISFGEAAEMATFGAKVLHPATLIPAMRCNIPVFVGSSREPEAGGTHIRQYVESKPTYRSIALRREQTLVTVKSPAMLHASGFLAKVFSILAKHELSVDLITTSEISVALTFDNPAGSTKALLNNTVIGELEQLCEVTVEHDLSLVAIIGNNLQDTKGLGSSVFETLNDYPVRMICHGASANNLCFLINENEANNVVAQLHERIFDF